MRSSLSRPATGAGCLAAHWTFLIWKCAKDMHLVDQLIKTDIDTARSNGITATPTLVIQDNQTGRSVKLEGMADETTLLSAIDWLAKDL